MTDEAQEASEDQAAEPVGGARLAAARVTHDISARDIAKELHLDEPTVLALEQNNFDLLGAPVFAKGHLRKYAELVGVPVEDVIADYYQMTRSEGLQPVVGRSQALDRAVLPGPWVAGAIIVLIVAGAGYWWYMQDRTPVPVTPVAATPAADVAERPATPPVESRVTVAETVAESEPEPESTTTQAASLPVIDTVADPAPAALNNELPITAGAAEIPRAEIADTEQVVASSTELPAAVNEAANLSPQTLVSISFSADCWTEVVDATGRRLFYDLGTAGRVANLSGVAPFQVILGDSASVNMTVDGREYPVPRPTRSGGLTRLTVNSQ